MITLYTLPDCIICDIIKEQLVDIGYTVTEEPLTGCNIKLVTDQLAKQMGAAPVIISNGVAIPPLDVTSGRLRCLTE